MQSQLTTLLNKESAMFGRKAVNQVEDHWRRFRDSECALQARPNKGGTVVPLVIGECDIQLTMQRIQELSEFPNSFPR